jgi:uncharacterized DUF497 family protein
MSGNAPEKSAAIDAVCYYNEDYFQRSQARKTLAERGLDFARAGEVFQGGHVTKDDNRKDYGERRLITWGHLDSRLVVVTWTPRGHAKRIISMRKANEREITRFSVNLG